MFWKVVRNVVRSAVVVYAISALAVTKAVNKIKDSTKDKSGKEDSLDDSEE